MTRFAQAHAELNSFRVRVFELLRQAVDVYFEIYLSGQIEQLGLEIRSAQNQ